MTEYNPLDEAPLERTELEEAQQENWKQFLKMKDVEIVIKECIELLENTDNGIGLICLNKLKNIEL